MINQSLGYILLVLLLVGCAPSPPPVALPSTPFAPVPSPTRQATAALTRSATAAPTRLASATTRASATATALPSTTASPEGVETRPDTPTRTETPLPSPTQRPPSLTATSLAPTATAPPPTAVALVTEGVACARPPEDYRRVMVGRHTVSMRTLAMLDNAQALYGGRGSTRLLIQGSYAPGLDASFGTHDGGGAVDVWAVDPRDTSQLLDDIPQLVHALRQSGFAAWYRPANMLYEGMYPHIHAIALGDAELSAGARSQIEGPEGYLAGRNGLPQSDYTGPDPHGGPLLCPWITELGYGAPAVTSQPTSTSAPPTPPTTLSLACAPPPDDYRRITVEGHTLTQRTYTMLQTAQAIYGGPGNLLWVTQGSYTPSEPGSFGTHDGGGAVDISIRHPVSWEFLYNDTEQMVRALRLAGFAAWYRAPGDLGPDSAPHLHAIAIGDGELSEAATAQLTGEQGYFRGRNGLPQPEYAREDRHGGPILCPWMEALGYQDLRN
ncbi:MAG: hypothetical protein H0T73_15755 [Ardenticatenales bacterium]|nr:hypothetical protein [Ardenticatenales bacterium]